MAQTMTEIELYLDYLFLGRCDGHISEDSATRILRTACQRNINTFESHYFALLIQWQFEKITLQ